MKSNLVNVHMRTHAPDSCFLPLSFMISRSLNSEEGETGNESIWLASLSPQSHHRPTYRMCHLQGMSFCPPPSNPLPPPPSVFHSRAMVTMGCNTPQEKSERAKMHTRDFFSFFFFLPHCEHTPEVLSMVNTATGQVSLNCSNVCRGGDS